MIEHREAGRFNMPMLVILAQGTTGRTHNLSATGVYFETDLCENKVDDLMTFRLFFDESEKDLSWVLRCSGKVIRTEPLKTGGIGIAVNMLEACNMEHLNSGGTGHVLQ